MGDVREFTFKILRKWLFLKAISIDIRVRPHSISMAIRVFFKANILFIIIFF